LRSNLLNVSICFCFQNCFEVLRQSLISMAGQGSYRNCLDDPCDLARYNSTIELKAWHLFILLYSYC
jgi:hypothetical protein